MFPFARSIFTIWFLNPVNKAARLPGTKLTITNLPSGVATYCPATPLNLSVLHSSSPVLAFTKTRRSFNEMANPSCSGMYTTFSSLRFWYFSVPQSIFPVAISKTAIWSLPILRSNRKTTSLSQNGINSSTLFSLGVKSL